MDLGTYLIAFCETDRATHGGMSFQGLYSIFEIGARFDKVDERGSGLLDIFTRRDNITFADYLLLAYRLWRHSFQVHCINTLVLLWPSWEWYLA